MGTFIATVRTTQRIRNSANGNPRCQVYFKEGGSAETAPDCTSAFNVIDNHSAPDRTDYGRPLRITTDAAGRITHAEQVSEEIPADIDATDAATALGTLRANICQSEH